MNRLPIAALLAIFLHGALLVVNFPESEKRLPMLSEFKTLNFSLLEEKSEILKKGKPPLPKPIQEIKKTVFKKIVEPSTSEQIEEALNETVDVPAEPMPQPPTAHQLNDTMEKDEKAASTSTSQVIQEARPLYLENPPPHYPMMARKRKYEGMVILEVFVDREGNVAEVRLFKTSGYRVLDKAALKSVTDWKFEPARRGPQAVSMWVRVPIRFRLED